MNVRSELKVNELNNDIIYKNFISLGHYCGVASSMSKYGLRASSGIFDWITSSFEGVLRCFENDFNEFFHFNNLQINEVDSKKIFDSKYKFWFIHDVNNDLNIEYQNIIDKYSRRIEKFKISISEPTCFIRSISDLEELKFINENYEFIVKLLKQRNTNNNIIFLLSHEFSNNNVDIKNLYIVNKYDGSTDDSLRGLFDGNQQLLSFFREHYNNYTRLENQLWDRERILCVKNKQVLSLKKQKDILKKIINLDTNSINNAMKLNIGIYGAGLNGKTLYYKIRECYNVCCFIDTYSNETEFDKIPIVRINDINNFNISLIVITTGYDYKLIFSDLTMERNVNILSLDEFLLTVD